MRVRTGTSGFSYPAWEGPFYPQGTKRPDMLAFYASRLGSVEINNTFYRMPKTDLLERWRDAVPDTFRFVLKVSRRITHHQRLRDAGDSVDYLFRTAQVLGERLGPFLFQLPPLPETGRRSAGGLSRPAARRHAAGRSSSAMPVGSTTGCSRCSPTPAPSLCIADSGGDVDAPLVATADFGYLRLRREDYDETALRSWAEKIRRQPWRETYVFFKHEDEGAGPRMAAEFEALLLES